MKLSDFDYELPPSLIAQRPTDQRDGSRLMVLDRSTRQISHHLFRDLLEFLRTDDCIVVNETRVRRARLFGHRRETGGAVEVLLVRPLEDGTWEGMVRPGRRLREGVEIVFEGVPVVARVEEVFPDGHRRLRFDGDVEALMESRGHVPLPPYIDRSEEAQDADRYQTVYARRPGAVAAPTAGLHFTEAMFEGVVRQGVGVARVLLHVGPGTFRPVESDDPTRHRMHSEYYEMDTEAVGAIQDAGRAGGRTIAVGTTTVRVLETVRGEEGLAPGSGWTDIFIYPPFEFRAVDALITNFHLPRSTLLMLVSAFAGREFVLEAYETAVEEEYRFYSYGDAMLIL
ncbi:MAG: tRNA preQ1(34) S-adenosylmethionine ribosyltransferase-isomerase QueA [Gemmatimonadetes bacterium]|nr:tRNA preQ1(34) S-adenosylmethionine ribosyltransferase-isomerase QueA [Gemmatimonadota bacterium]